MLHFFQTHLLSNTVTAWAATFNRGQLHRIIYRVLLGVLTLARDIQLAIVNKWRRFWLVISIYVSNAMCFGSAIPSVPLMLARGYAIEAITATIDWIKENGFSLIKAGVNPENTLSKKLLIRIGFNFSSIEDGWAYLCSGFNKRRIISRREKPMRPFQAYFNMHSSVSSAFSSKWVGIQFPKYITLFLLKHIPPITTC